MIKYVVDVANIWNEKKYSITFCSIKTYQSIGFPYSSFIIHPRAHIPSIESINLIAVNKKPSNESNFAHSRPQHSLSDSPKQCVQKHSSISSINQSLTNEFTWNGWKLKIKKLTRCNTRSCNQSPECDRCNLFTFQPKCPPLLCLHNVISKSEIGPTFGPSKRNTTNCNWKFACRFWRVSQNMQLDPTVTECQPKKRDSQALFLFKIRLNASDFLGESETGAQIEWTECDWIPVECAKLKAKI